MTALLSKMIRILVSVLMMISPSLPGLFSLPAIPQGQELELDSRFELIWSDEFEGTDLDKTKWQYNWWETERKGRLLARGYGAGN